MTIESIISSATAKRDMEMAEDFRSAPSARKFAADLLIALEVAGYVVVPKEPSEEMKRAGIAIFWDAPAGKIYRAMIEARPQ